MKDCELMRSVKFRQFLFASVFIPLVSFAGDARKIKFFRPAVPGQKLNCKISAESESIYIMSLPDNTQVKKVNRYNVNITGIMLIKSVTEYGHPALVEFEVDEIKGKLNDKEQLFLCRRRILVIDQDCVGRTDLNERQVCSFYLKNSPEILPQDELKLLSLIFRPSPKENLHDFMGTDKEIQIGDSWSAPAGPLINVLKQQNINLNPSRIKGEIVLKAKKEFNDIECWQLEEELKTEDAPDFEFSFSANVLLPVDEEVGVLKLSRNGVQRFARKIPDTDYMTAGLKDITVIISDKMEAELLPVDK